MGSISTETASRPGGGRRERRELIPREYLRTIAIWSLLPAYLVAGALIGWFADRWLGSFPYGLGIGMLIALALAVRDMLRLRSDR